MELRIANSNIAELGVGQVSGQLSASDVAIRRASSAPGGLSRRNRVSQDRQLAGSKQKPQK